MQDFRQQLTRERRSSTIGGWEQFDLVKAGNYHLSIQASEYAHCTPPIDLDNPYDYTTFEVVIKNGSNGRWVHPSSIKGVETNSRLNVLFCDQDLIGYRVPVTDIQELYESLSNPNPERGGRGTMHERINRATEVGLESFWRAVASRFPEIRTGDLDPIMVMHSEAEMLEAVQQWVELNSETQQETQENG
jgi:hypothetical protein